ncbi:hypothetical protein SPRG_09317 [Saprolegnia parasitica CBS 223.65]|uniref:AAA+ ATPase domain-containing protein n=1 Tax=Saprolegnia parasitica (strain CBS 223.65) TaxID=695850 RepID=A0A067CFQ0_SAPPC|nr:hypothetical protein SPRG_09317 [Saprolegnia parasitica CBS 223.65]KDO25376.1 hypothetical protein SPRG_09317 [Saprolegnia parasitica CBS 223.65]|eukprot:XP_012203804.1 hypothetical protein SPRG_09317 [Saprolegnia parasitica CBS 223.65]
MDSSSLLQVGLASSLRTGHFLVDACICLLLPVLFSYLVASESSSSSWAESFDKLLLYLGVSPRRVVRVIQSKFRIGSYGETFNDTEHSHLLQRAIAYYVSATVDMASKRTARLELVTGLNAVSRLEPEGPPKKPRSIRDLMPNPDVTTLEIHARPPLREWVDVAPEIALYHEIESTQRHGQLDSDEKWTTVTYTLRSFAPDGAARINAFVDTAFTSYQDAIVAQKLRDRTRYMYVAAQTHVATTTGAEAKSIVPLSSFKRYALSDHKTFDSLFFSSKTTLLDLLDTFTAKRGKYAIPGFPHKLGFLLHGPPGTGKTSLIKAIAQHTKRHIVNISLANIKTNQELMDCMLDLSMNVPGEDMPVKLSYDKVVFVMEDIDCASEVVHARKECAATVEPAVSFGGTVITLAQPQDKFTPHDQLNLSGLLNVLDGVVDMSGRILIMTSNHPEKLDPALIRPGRIDEQLYMGAMDATQASLMVQHYFATTLTIDEKAEIEGAVTTCAISPAQVENLCAKHRDLHEMLTALTAHADMSL